MIFNFRVCEDGLRILRTLSENKTIMKLDKNKITKPLEIVSKGRHI